MEIEHTHYWQHNPDPDYEFSATTVALELLVPDSRIADSFQPISMHSVRVRRFLKIGKVKAVH